MCAPLTVLRPHKHHNTVCVFPECTEATHLYGSPCARVRVRNAHYPSAESEAPVRYDIVYMNAEHAALSYKRKNCVWRPARTYRHRLRNSKLYNDHVSVQSHACAHSYAVQSFPTYDGNVMLCSAMYTDSNIKCTMPGRTYGTRRCTAQRVRSPMVHTYIPNVKWLRPGVQHHAQANWSVVPAPHLANA